MIPPTAVIAYWFRDPAEAVVRPQPIRGGFSGACHWRVEHRGTSLVLRRWGREHQRDRLAPIHALLGRLAAAGAPTPSPQAAPSGDTLLEHDGHCWELSPWLPGEADYWVDSRPSKLAAALEALARLHLAAASAPPSIRPFARFVHPAIARRLEGLEQLRSGGLVELRQRINQLPPGAERDRAGEVLDLAAKAAPAEIDKARRWRRVELPLQWCHRDVWHDHVLFTGEQVTGIIDFGAASWDTPAVDVSRLLGSLAGDDPLAWRDGLAAYEAIRPLDAQEREAVDFLDSSAVLLSPLNWIRWLHAPDSQPLAFDRPAAIARLSRQIVRLRTLAAGAR